MLQDPQVLGNVHNKPIILMSDPTTTMYCHNMSCDLSIKYCLNQYYSHGGRNMSKCMTSYLPY